MSESEYPTTTWWMDLEALDVAYAHFEHRPPSPMVPSSATIRVDRDQWESLGRPSTVKVTITRDEAPGRAVGEGRG